MTPITGCVISLDEEDRIEHCLRSLSFCDEVVVLDSGSSDRTRQLAEACGARVETQDFLGYSAQNILAESEGRKCVLRPGGSFTCHVD